MIRNNFKRCLDEKLGISIAEVCAKTGLHRSVVGRLYRGEIAQISFDTLDALCGGLKIRVSNIIAHIPDHKASKDGK